MIIITKVETMQCDRDQAFISIDKGYDYIP